MSLSKKVFLTISGYDIKLSDNLTFYQNDQLKLIFCINEYGIDVEHNTNARALMPVNPLKAILFVENPDGVDSVSSAKVEENTVTFYLDSTHTKYVGVSRMQLRLFDQDGCVVTLPHFTFEIRENIYGDTEVKFENVVLIDNDGSAIVTESGQMLDVGDIMLIDAEAVYPETQKEISGLPQKTTFTGAERLLIQDDEGAKQIALQKLVEAISSLELSEVAKTGDYNDLINKPDLSDYVTTQVLSTKVDKVNGKGLSTNDYTDEDKIKLRSLTNADVNKAYVDTELAKKSNVNHTHSQYLTAHQDISGLATKDELATGLATKANKNEIPSISGLATETYVQAKIAEAQLDGGEVDLSGYATKDDLNKKSDLTHNHNGVYSQLSHTHSQYLTTHQDISHKANISDLATVATSGSYNDLKNKPTIPSISGLATTEYVDNRIASISLSAYQTSTDNNLQTTNKTIVGAINELYALLQSNDGGSTNTTYGNIVLSKTSLSMTVDSTNTFTVKLDKAPTNNQTVTISHSNSYVTVSPSTLTFTSSNYNTAQSVTVRGVSAGSTTITVSSPNVSSQTVNCSITATNVGETPGDSENSDLYFGDTYVTLGNRTVGYQADFGGETVSGATIVTSASALKTAISNAAAGDTIYVRSGTYTVSGGLTISKAGTSSKYITIKNYPNETPVLTGTAVTFSSSCKYINFEGFVIKDMSNLDWGTCVHVSGGASYINLRNLEITNIKCRPFSSSSSNGCNPLVLHGDSSNSINNILIENCYVHDCDTGWSEAITADGNVENCIIRNCTVDNNKNIGIDLAGNFEWTGTVGDATNQARSILVENNLVMNCQSPYATSAGLYCDGGRDNTFRYNVIYNCQCGIELGAEEPGATVQNFYVYGNLIIDSGRSIGVGGYQSTSATHKNSYIYNNTIICGNSNEENYGLMIERTSNLKFVNNIIYGASGTTLYSNGNGTSVTLQNNCWYKSSGSKPSQDSTGIFANPSFINNTGKFNGNYNLSSTSPCINKGASATETYVGTVDLNANARTNGTIDIGAFEYYKDSTTTNTPITPNPPNDSPNPTNVMPAFSNWYLPTDCTLISSSDYSYSFSTSNSWTGLTLDYPTEWIGKTVTIGVNNISSNAGLYIQNTSTWEDIGVITSTTKEVTITVTNGINAVMCLQPPSVTSSPITISGLYAYVN